MLLKVKKLAGKEMQIMIDPKDTIQEVKFKIEEKEGIPPDQQRLIHSGTVMENGRTVESYQLSDGSAIHLVLRLR